MIERAMKLALAVVAPLILLGCVLTPGKFVSTLTINADRSFAFAYKGEVIAINPGEGMTDGLKDKPADGGPSEKPAAILLAAEAGKTDADTEAKNRAIAATLSKEAGYRSVAYLGKGKFAIDYAVSGTLTHNFVYPFNSDAEVVFPFLVVELRQGGTVRVRAPGFANSGGSSPQAGMGPMAGEAAKALDGVFTLDTDAEIVSQNNEDGAKTAGARRTIAWRATPLTKDAPVAVLRLGR